MEEEWYGEEDQLDDDAEPRTSPSDEHGYGDYLEDGQYEEEVDDAEPAAPVMPVVPPPPPPEQEWQEHIDASSNMPYYYNARTGESSWTRPAGWA